MTAAIPGRPGAAQPAELMDAALVLATADGNHCPLDVRMPRLDGIRVRRFYTAVAGADVIVSLVP